MEEGKVKIVASFILEMLGRPKEHLDETLNRLVDKLGSEKGVNILERKVYEPKKFEQEKLEPEKEEKLKELTKENKNLTMGEELYTSFAEIEAEFDDIKDLLMISFNYMPSNIEIVKPQTFILRNSDIGEILTGTVLRLHRYDEVAKKLSVDKTILESELKRLSGGKD